MANLVPAAGAARELEERDFFGPLQLDFQISLGTSLKIEVGQVLCAGTVAAHEKSVAADTW